MPPSSRSSLPLSADAVAQRLHSCGFSPESSQVAQLTTYLELLMKWNRVMNLIGPYRWDEALEVLIMDSLHLAVFLDGLQLPSAPRCWDFGAGAGLPGIPLRIVWNKGAYYMVEVREKRALFLVQTVARLSLAETHVFRGRAEDFMENEEPADLLVSRAFMPWEKLLPFVEGRLRPAGTENEGGRVIVLGLNPAPDALPATWALEREQAYTVGRDTRYFWSLRPKNALI